MSAWHTYLFSLQGAAGLNTFGFESLANLTNELAAGGNLLDNVSLSGVNQEVPEPTTAALLGTGLLAVHRRRKGKAL